MSQISAKQPTVHVGLHKDLSIESIRAKSKIQDSPQCAFRAKKGHVAHQLNVRTSVKCLCIDHHSILSWDSRRIRHRKENNVIVLNPIEGSSSFGSRQSLGTSQESLQKTKLFQLLLTHGGVQPKFSHISFKVKQQQKRRAPKKLWD